MTFEKIFKNNWKNNFKFDLGRYKEDSTKSLAIILKNLFGLDKFSKIIKLEIVLFIQIL